MLETITAIFAHTWHYLTEASPWLLLGFLFAGLLKAFVPSGVLLKHLKKGPRSILTATLIGIPLPLCSCGVIPTGIALYQHGASRASTLAFFIATPATTITSILILLGMLGWEFALVQVIACFSIAALTGLLALILLKEKPRMIRKLEEVEHRVHIRDLLISRECQSELKRGLKTAFRYGFIDMVNDIGPYLMLGLLAAGLIAALVPPSLIEQHLGAGLLPLLAMVLIATPLYVCSTGSVPLVASLIGKGMHPGAGLVFLIAGPATNLSTILVIGKSMGGKTALLYVASIIIFSVLIAYGFSLVGCI